MTGHEALSNMRGRPMPCSLRFVQLLGAADARR